MPNLPEMRVGRDWRSLPGGQVVAMPIVKVMIKLGKTGVVI
jgi:hypothetical protein